MSDETTARKALVEACIKAKKCTNTADLRKVIPELIRARDELIALQKAEAEKESQEFDKLVPDLNAFSAWLVEASQKEYSGSAIEFRSAGDSKGNGVFIKDKKFIRKEDVAMCVPLKVCLYAQFNDATGGIALPPFVAQNDFVKTLPSLELTVALLLELTKGSKSFFAPYLAILPRRLDTIPLNWNEHEMGLIKDDSCLALVVSRLRDICLAYCVMSEDSSIRSLLGTYQRFAWAVCVVNSRQNPLPAPPGAGGKSKVVLIPAFDMCNHDPSGSAIMTEFSWESKCFECRAHKSFEAGEEFTIFYGPRPDVELLLYSGFVALPAGVSAYTALILPFRLSLQDAPDIAKVKKVLIDKVPGVAPTGNDDYYLLSLGGSLGDSAVRIFARAAAAKTKEQAQVALKKKLETPTSSLTDLEKEFVRTSIAGLKKPFAASGVPTGVDLTKCRESVIRVADELRQSSLAVLNRIEASLMKD